MLAILEQVVYSFMFGMSMIQAGQRQWTAFDKYNNNIEEYNHTVAFSKVELRFPIVFEGATIGPLMQVAGKQLYMQPCSITLHL